MAAVKIKHKNCLQSTLRKKIINTLFAGLGRSVLGKTVPSVLSTAEDSRPLAQFFPIRTSRPANDIHVLKFNRENERFERGKLNSRCFHWFPAAMLESLRRAPTWRLHIKNYNFQWYLLPNNSNSDYRTSVKPWHVVYLLILYDISISWLNLLNGKLFYFLLTW